MITKKKKLQVKMFKTKVYCIICAFVIFFAIAKGDRFIVLKSPKSLEFKGNLPLSPKTIDSIYTSSLGYSPSESESNEWEGLTIIDPFNPAKAVVNIFIEGFNDIEFKGSKSFNLYGNGDFFSYALDNIVTDEGTLVDLDLKQNKNRTFATVFGMVEPRYKQKLHLKTKAHQEIQGVLDQIAIIDSLSEMLKKNEEHIPIIMIIRVSMECVQKDAMIHNEITKTLKTSIENFAVSVEKVYKKRALFTIIATSNVLHQRIKRATTTSEDEKFNIAPSYDKNYPVVFNIIFWFSVVMFFSLLAVSLAIGNMDPGRDSIIYRMTSTRMKKDN